MATSVELLERAIGYAMGSLRTVEPRFLSRPTPCEQWNLERLLLHLCESLNVLREGIGTRLVTGLVTVEESRDPVTAVRNAACQLLGDSIAVHVSDLDVAIGDQRLSADVMIRTGGLEITAHGWDIARACRSRGAIPAALADDLLNVAPSLLADSDRHALFAAPVVVPPRVSSSDRFVAYLGRDPFG